MSDLASARAHVVSVSNRAAAGIYEDTTGPRIVGALEQVGFGTVTSAVVPDGEPVAEALKAAVADGVAVVVTTGGTGLTPRDVTPQATTAVIDYQVPGLAEAMRAEGRRHTPMADLSRAVVGVCGRTLIVNLPGSPKGAIESLDAIVAVLNHALETLAGPFDHGSAAPAAPDAASDLADPRVIAFPDEHE